MKYTFNITKLHMILWRLVGPAEVKLQLKFLQFRKPVKNFKI